MSLRSFHILISHSWDYSEHYETICKWLDESKYFKWSNYSVPLTNPIDAHCKKELKDKLKEKIAKCSCIIVLSGMYVDYSEWIDYEMQVAQDYEKPIIGVKPWGQQRIPSKIKEMADVLVGWNSGSVVNAVREYAL